MTDTLDRMIDRLPNAGANHKKQSNILGLSGSLTAEDASSWPALVDLTPPESEDGASWSVGLFAGPGRDFLLAAAYADAQTPLIEYVLIPRKLAQQAVGNLDPLVALLLDTPQMATCPPDGRIDPLDAPTVLPWSFEDRLKHFQLAFDQAAGGEIDRLLRLLAAALDERHLRVQSFSGDTRARLAFVQGLMALLPARARADLTFSTHASGTTSNGPRIVFAEDDLDTTRLTADFAAAQSPDLTLSDRPYAALLRDFWQGDSEPFMQALADLEPLAEAILTDKEWIEGLNQLAAQVRLNEQIRRGETVAPEALKATLIANLPLPFDLMQRCTELLLEHALAARDTEAGLLVALQMDEDPDLDAALQPVIDSNLETQPDAVYVFVRARLNDAMEADERWIERLQAAALVSLRVAITDADSETIVNWLRLIAREPASYNLSGILRDGILAAQERARSDGELARSIVTLAIKHAPEVLDSLLEDTELLAVLPNNLGLVLRDYAGDPLYTLQNRGPEMFLVAMARAARAQAAQIFTPEVVDQLWKIYATGQTFPIPAHYVPESVIHVLTTEGVLWLPTDILGHLGTLMLADGRDALFIEFAAQLADVDLLMPVLADALHGSQRSIDDVTTVINQLAAAQHLGPQAVADLYIDLLERRGWRQTALPLVEQLARMIQQNPALDIDSGIFWHLLEVAMAARSDMVARVAAQQLFSEIDNVQADDDVDLDTEIVDTLQRLSDSLQWSQPARSHLLKWWRDFVHDQPLAHLTRIDRVLESRKTLADCRAVVQTSLAFRRMLGNRTMADFADAINLLFSVLADVAESFDPSPRQTVSFDEETVRSELDARRSELTDHEWRILAKNFKELAALIGTMGDHRSRASLVRQNVDRQLLAGAQQPESAVDAMKWMAGYLEGIQGRSESAEE